MPDTTTPSQAAELLTEAASRLRFASLAVHHVPTRLRDTAGWLQIAASVHASEIGCEWCADPHRPCPAVETALALVHGTNPDRSRPEVTR